MIGNTFFNRALRKQHRQAKAFPDYQKVKSILLLFNSDKQEANLAVQSIIRSLFHEGRQVDALGYINKPTAITAASPHYRIMSRRDITCLGKPKKEVRQQLEQKHYDLLIDLTLSPTLPLQYAAIMAQADFKTGRQTAKPYPYDFMIQLQGNEDAAYLYSQIRFYLQQIKTQD